MVAWLALGVAALAGVLALADGESGLRTWWGLRGELRSAEARIEVLRGELARLERDGAGLEADPFSLERAIRERLEFARPGETVVRAPGSEHANPRIP